jgi:hypothetical protein
MKWLAAGLLLLIVVLILAQPTVVNRQWRQFWEALAPNLLAELVGLAVALGLAEVWIRSYRTRRGIAEVGPLVLKLLNPAFELDLRIINKLDYTPEEFKAIYQDYLDGDLSPTHIPAEFKNRLETACKTIDAATIEKALLSWRDAEEFLSKFAGLLDPLHVMLFHVGATGWAKFRDEFAKNPPDKTDLAEAYLDAHDTVNDVSSVFSLDKVAKSLRSLR